MYVKSHRATVFKCFTSNKYVFMSNLCLFVSKLFIWWRCYTNETGDSRRHIIIANEVWGYFFFQKHELFSFFFLNKSTVVVPQEAVVYVMFLHFWNFCQLHVKLIRSKYIHAKKMYLWMFYVISSLKPGRCVKLILNHKHGSWPRITEFYVRSTAQIESIKSFSWLRSRYFGGLS